jgi:hypothetical protein
MSLPVRVRVMECCYVHHFRGRTPGVWPGITSVNSSLLWWLTKKFPTPDLREARWLIQLDLSAEGYLSE